MSAEKSSETQGMTPEEREKEHLRRLKQSVKSIESESAKKKSKAKSDDRAESDK